MAERPELWAETVRALMVHSAECTPAMCAWFNAAGSQTQKAALLRRYGWGLISAARFFVRRTTLR